MMIPAEGALDLPLWSWLNWGALLFCSEDKLDVCLSVWYLWEVNLPGWRSQQTLLHQLVEVQAGHDESNALLTLQTFQNQLLNSRKDPERSRDSTYVRLSLNKMCLKKSRIICFFCSTFTLQIPMMKPGARCSSLTSLSLPRSRTHWDFTSSFDIKERQAGLMERMRKEWWRCAGGWTRHCRGEVSYFLTSGLFSRSFRTPCSWMLWMW